MFVVKSEILRNLFIILFTKNVLCNKYCGCLVNKESSSIECVNLSADITCFTSKSAENHYWKSGYLFGGGGNNFLEFALIMQSGNKCKKFSQV